MLIRAMGMSAAAMSMLLAGPTATKGCESTHCSCYTPERLHITPAQFVSRQRDQAERVALGEVTRIDTLAATSWGTGYDRVTVHPIVARVAVRRVWRGPTVDTMTVMFAATDAWSSCDLPLRQGASYVLFAKRTEGGPLATRQCAGTAEVGSAAATLVVLGKGQTPRP